MLLYMILHINSILKILIINTNFAKFIILCKKQSKMIKKIAIYIKAYCDFYIESLRQLLQTCKILHNLLLPRVSNIISSKVSFPIGVADIISPWPNVRCFTLSPTANFSPDDFAFGKLTGPKFLAELVVTSLASYAEVGKLVPGVGFCHERERERSTNSSGISL